MQAKQQHVCKEMNQFKGQGPTKVIMVCDTPPYGYAPTVMSVCII